MIEKEPVSPNRRRSRWSVQPGAEPGTLIDNPLSRSCELELFVYNPETIVEKKIDDVAQIEEIWDRQSVLWVNLDGAEDATVVRKIGELFGFHKLALEDVLSGRQRAKVEEYEGFLFIIAKMLMNGAELETEQLSMFVGQNFVVTFQECPGGDPFDLVRDRIRKKTHSKIRSAGADYLAYALLDAVIDHYYPCLEEYGEILDELEVRVTSGLDSKTVNELHSIKRDLLTLRRAVWPLRDAVNTLLRDESAYVSKETRVYLRDCYDHVVVIIDWIETYRELGSSLTEVYLSSSSNRMNAIMKVLTIISTIFLPATLIAGIYGMNFSPERSPLNMPELNWYYGYIYALALMAVLTVVTLSLFGAKGWLGNFGFKASEDRTSSGGRTAERSAD
jgi:magnesium transporter